MEIIPTDKYACTHWTNYNYETNFIKLWLLGTLYIDMILGNFNTVSIFQVIHMTWTRFAFERIYGEATENAF